MTAPLLPAATLAQFRALEEANMPSVCELLIMVNTRGPGGVTMRAAATKAIVACRLSIVASSLALLAEQFTPEAQYVLTLPALTDTTGVERAIVSGVTAGAPWEIELRITGTDEPRSYSASRRLRAVLATDPVGHPSGGIPYPSLTQYPAPTLFPLAA